jgi:hypothetical protein
MSLAILYRKGLGFEDSMKLETREVGKEANVRYWSRIMVTELYLDFEHAV